MLNILKQGKYSPMYSFKKILLEKIEKSGLSMRALSLKSGLEESTIKKIIYGNALNPRIDTVQKIANGLKCRALDLLPPEWDNSQDVVNVNILQQAILTVISVIKKDKKRPTDEQIAASISLLYEKLQKEGAITDTQIIKLINKKD